jgi:dTDP-L-rhamnose 4-epimerase
VSERVLVTGGAGFIGSHTVDHLLDSGAEVRVLDNLHPQVHPRGGRPRHLAREAELVVGDVRDPEVVASSLRGVTHVLHLAAETSVGQSMFRPDLHIDVNVRGTAVLLRALRESDADISRLVVSSSRAVYGEGAHFCSTCGVANPGPRRQEDLEAGGWSHRCPVCGGRTDPVPTAEDIAPRYASVYGMTKLFQEQVSEMGAEQLGIPLVVLRYFNVYGPRQSPANAYTGLIVTLALRLLADRPLVLYEGGTPVRDFVHVDDVAAANVSALLGTPPAERTLNVGSGIGVSLTDLVGVMGAAFGRAPDVELSARYRVGDIHSAVADISRARHAIGFMPRRTLDEGLRGLAPDLQSGHATDRSDEVESELRRQGVLKG